MNNAERILDYLRIVFPESKTNQEIKEATHIEPHQQVFQLTQKLMLAGLIQGKKVRNEWQFQAIENNKINSTVPQVIAEIKHENQNAREFEKFARERFSDYFKTSLYEKQIRGVKKKWDLVSEDERFIGDAKYYQLVRGNKRPPAKLAVISEHVWLLEKTSAQNKFLVFGNQIEVPQMWLHDYGNLLRDVDFYFLEDNAEINKLN